MGRPRTDPIIRYADIAHTMRFIMDHDELFEMDCGTVNAAIVQLQRFHTYRKIVRENNDGLTMMDSYVFSRTAHKIKIFRRPQINPDSLRDANGNPVGERIRAWEAAEHEREYGAPKPGNVPRYNDDHNPAAPNKPLKLDD